MVEAGLAAVDGMGRGRVAPPDLQPPPAGLARPAQREAVGAGPRARLAARGAGAVGAAARAGCAGSKGAPGVAWPRARQRRRAGRPSISRVTNRVGVGARRVAPPPPGSPIRSDRSPTRAGSRGQALQSARGAVVGLEAPAGGARGRPRLGARHLAVQPRCGRAWRTSPSRPPETGVGGGRAGAARFHGPLTAAGGSGGLGRGVCGASAGLHRPLGAWDGGPRRRSGAGSATGRRRARPCRPPPGRATAGRRPAAPPVRPLAKRRSRIAMPIAEETPPRPAEAPSARAGARAPGLRRRAPLPRALLRPAGAA